MKTFLQITWLTGFLNWCSGFYISNEWFGKIKTVTNNTAWKYIHVDENYNRPDRFDRVLVINDNCEINSCIYWNRSFRCIHTSERIKGSYWHHAPPFPLEIEKQIHDKLMKTMGKEEEGRE